MNGFQVIQLMDTCAITVAKKGNELQNMFCNYIFSMLFSISLKSQKFSHFIWLIIRSLNCVIILTNNMLKGKRMCSLNTYISYSSFCKLPDCLQPYRPVESKIQYPACLRP